MKMCVLMVMGFNHEQHEIIMVIKGKSTIRCGFAHISVSWSGFNNPTAIKCFNSDLAHNFLVHTSLNDELQVKTSCCYWKIPFFAGEIFHDSDAPMTRTALRRSSTAVLVTPFSTMRRKRRSVWALMPRVPKIWIYNGYIMGENGHNNEIFIYIYIYQWDRWRL